MTRAEFEVVLRLWQRRLGLDHWEIELSWEWGKRPDDKPDVDGDEHPPPNCDASTYRARDYDTATVYLHPVDAETWSPRKAHATVVHELLHLVTRDVEFVLDQLDAVGLARDVDELLVRGHRHAVEGAIDRLAHRFVDLAGDVT